MPSALGGLSEGLWNTVDQARAENDARQREQDSTERSMLQALLNSDDPKVQSLAVGGILDMGLPKRRMKGVQGFLGEYDRIPQLQQIHDYLNTPQTKTAVTHGLPSRTIPTGVADMAPPNVAPSPDAGRAPSAAGAGALPATSPVTGGPVVGVPPPTVNGQASTADQASVAHPDPRLAGTPPPTMGSAFTQPHAGPDVGNTETTTTYPHAFYTPEERVSANIMAQKTGEIQAIAQSLRQLGVPEDEVQRVVKWHVMGGLRGMGMQKGGWVDVPDGKGGFTLTQATFSPFGGYLDSQTGGALPPGSRPHIQQSAGMDRDAIARAKFSQPFDLLTPEQQQDVNDDVVQLAGQKAGASATGRMAAEATGPLSHNEVQRNSMELQKQWLDLSKGVRTMKMMLGNMDAGMDMVNKGNPNGGGIAVLNAFAKINDVLSAVRENEYERPYIGQPLMDRFDAAYQRLFGSGGTGLTPEQLQQFADTAKEMTEKVEASISPERQRIIRQAKKLPGVDPADIISDYTPGEETTPGAAPGATPAPAPAASASQGLNLTGAPTAPAAASVPRQTVPGATPATPTAAPAAAPTAAPGGAQQFSTPAAAPGSRGPVTRATVETWATTPNPKPPHPFDPISVQQAIAYWQHNGFTVQ